jgi:hypothetical protein
MNSMNLKEDTFVKALDSTLVSGHEIEEFTRTMLWWTFLVFHGAYHVCPPGCQYYYDVKITLSLNESQWLFFWTTIIDTSHPLHIAVSSSGPYELHIGHHSDCPDRNDSILLRARTGRSYLAIDFFADGDSQVQAFGLYAVGQVTLKLTIQDHFQGQWGLSVPMKLSIPVAAIAFPFLGYDFLRRRRKL